MPQTDEGPVARVIFTLRTRRPSAPRARTPRSEKCDEAHHLLPLEFVAGVAIAPKELTSTALVTVRPDLISPEILKMVDGIVAVGKDPETNR